VSPLQSPHTILNGNITSLQRRSNFLMSR